MSLTVSFAVDGDRLQVELSPTASGSFGSGKRVFVFTPVRSFELSRGQRTQPFALAGLYWDEEGERVKPSIYQNTSGILFSHFDTVANLDEILSSGDCLEATGSDGLTEVTFSKLQYFLRLDVSTDLQLVGIEVKDRGESGAIISDVRNATFLNEPAQTIAPKTIKRRFMVGDEDRVISTVTLLDISFEPPPAEIFELSSYGLPDVIRPEKSTPQLFVQVFFLGLIFLFLGWAVIRHNRSRSNQSGVRDV